MFNTMFHKIQFWMDYFLLVICLIFSINVKMVKLQITRVTLLFTIVLFRSNHQRCSIEKGVLENFTKFTGKHLFQVGSFIKKRFWHRCSPVNFVKFLRTPFSQNTSRWLLKVLDMPTVTSTNYRPLEQNFLLVSLLRITWNLIQVNVAYCLFQKPIKLYLLVVEQLLLLQIKSN